MDLDSYGDAEPFGVQGISLNETPNLGSLKPIHCDNSLVLRTASGLRVPCRMNSVAVTGPERSFVEQVCTGDSFKYNAHL